MKFSKFYIKRILKKNRFKNCIFSPNLYIFIRSADKWGGFVYYKAKVPFKIIQLELVSREVNYYDK